MSAFDAILEKYYPPSECTESFEGKVVLVTGANTGLGLETAKKVAALGAQQLIITTRSQSKGEITKKQIYEWLIASGSTSKTEIVPLVLNMNTAESVKSFVNELTSTTDKLNAVVLNAGMNQPLCKISPDGYEETLQVNTISTIFVATLLLPLLIATADSSNTQTHITFVSSRMSLVSSALPSAEFQKSATPVQDLAQTAGFPQQILGGQIRYGQSKLLLEYAVRRMSKLPAVLGKDRNPKVIINTVCPGMCKTEIGRNYDHWFLKFVMEYVIMPFLAKSAAQGATSYLAALTAGPESQGQMWAVTHYSKEWDAIKSPEGKAFGDKVWQELQDMMTGWEPSVRKVLQA